MHYACRKLWAWRTIVPKILLAAERYPDEGVAQSVNINRTKSGNVPDSRHWTYALNGGQLYLTNMAAGERIEIDIHNGPELIEIDSFCAVVRAQLFPGAAVQRFGELFPSGGLLAAFNRLRACGAFHVVEEQPGGDVLTLHLHDSLLKCPDAVHAFLMAWDRLENRIALPSVICDWPAYRGRPPPLDKRIWPPARVFWQSGRGVAG